MSQTEIEASALQAVPFFASLPTSDLAAVVRRARVVRFQPGEAIVERGDRGCTMYVVLSGQARVEVGGRYHDLKRGDFVGEMSVLSSKPRMATVRAVEALETAEIDCGDGDTFLTENPGLAVQMLKVLVERLREVEERLDAWMGAHAS